MIAVDTSALMAILMGEPEAGACAAPLQLEDRLLISAATVAEALIVAGNRNLGEEMTGLLEGLGFEVVAVTTVAAKRVGQVYRKWGKGAHPAALNVGDCFAYEVAKEYSCRLLYVSSDFSQTHIEGVLEARRR